MLRTELDVTTKKITASLSKEIKEISKRTDTLETRMDDTTTVLEGHETDIDTLRFQLQELQDKIEDMENRSRRVNIRIRGLPESYKNLEDDMTEFFSNLVPQLPTSKLEIDRIHRALGRPPQEGNPRDVILKLTTTPPKKLLCMQQATIAKRQSFKPITAVLQQHNIKYRWAFPFRLYFLHRGKQYSATALEEATELLHQLQLKLQPPTISSPQGAD
ncbi:hypothetical protein XELAEV_18016891mg [Xenopus laevis]|uniref:L1 transposable element RRM domain-containing protein n=1 Tax=Xenopus laevis TaxID=8355 RepID=A0A974DA55_XENLA|nr:hypothetical protein XELAEV_18016891mg [Xenopus laevis]